MEDQKSTVFKVNLGIGIMGTTSVTTSVGENSKKTVIERHGSTIGNLIPSVIVICEDNLAKTILGMVASEAKGSFKIITAGAWDNMPTLLYGIYVFRVLLKESGDNRFLEVLCVTDGDIGEEKLEKVCRKVHSGINVPDDMKQALSLIEGSLYGFELDKSKRIGGLPEYNHQLWLNEVSHDVVIAHHQERIQTLESYIERADEKVKPGIELQLILLKRDMAEVNRIADASRGILPHTLKDKKGRVDCHEFYGVLKAKLSEGDTLNKYPLHHLDYSVLSIIRQYNPVRWQAYIAPVKDAMEKAFANHVKMFTPDRFNLTEIGGGT
ncbi:hypothetical protein SAMN03159382_04120 [Pseudomonas sp. NFACC23-1]|uniref:hypothetical protein n=1 Tax=unclassified Pseudomonas TaxID=196821 RepID=UPI00088661B0|nr:MULTISPECIES: hypothetical protein [unclassified Pseudomonas]SDB53841.1 hypothetical protein SAMN03159386_04112 [Pseudomonas sp. NFACC17-2]SEJ74373.1 hypothetical protein SAMN03159382_04120 [Pseudomonas sp. NFACC23-1]SFW86268.1 hypothetical protein SAMN05660640_04497 [Pseudomonas sp. NFACC16-2]